MNNLIIVSGYFNPLHVGHLDYINSAADLGDVCVIVNNDKQCKLKGSIFMNEDDRGRIIHNLKLVKCVYISIDNDRTVCNTIEKIYNDAKDKDKNIFFAKGGDSTIDNVPELELCNKLGIKVILNIGGTKTRNSSDYRKKKELK